MSILKVPETCLPVVFDKMTASYKAYWFIGFLECFVEEGNDEIPIRNICSRMLANAWYPIHFFKLHFGAQDLIVNHNHKIKDYLNIKADIKKDNLLDILYHSEDVAVIKWVMHFKKQVTYRFLSPWIKFKSNSQVEKDSQSFINGSPYAIFRDQDVIVINDDWKNYLRNNYKLLLDYGYWCLSQYLQNKNPGVPDISGKLVKPAIRSSLNIQRKYWNIVFEKEKTIQCIYSNKILTADKFVVEHYIPWSYTTHNLIWNLIPADSSINSSKSNKLPDNIFLKKFVMLQKRALGIVYQTNMNHKLFEDFAVFGDSVSNMLDLEDDKFFELYNNQISPQIILAHQLGFQFWNFK